MANTVIERRSQAIMVLPVDNVPAQLVAHDGARFDVVLFVPAGEDVPSVLSGTDRFVPMIRKHNVSLVARDVIAALAVPAPAAPPPSDDDLPATAQRVHVHLRSGVMIEGELRGTGAPGGHRTTDVLNEAVPYLAVFADGLVYYVAKAHIAIVDEKSSP